MEMTQMKHRTLRMTIAMALLGSLAVGCAHSHEGPMEKAGRKTDDAAHDIKEGARDAKEDLK
jgi:hypothetical protein